MIERGLMGEKIKTVFFRENKELESEMDEGSVSDCLYVDGQGIYSSL